MMLLTRTELCGLAARITAELPTSREGSTQRTAACISLAQHPLGSLAARSLMYALFHGSLPHMWAGSYATAKANIDELVVLDDEKGTLHWIAKE
jgi:hypothetical protein